MTTGDISLMSNDYLCLINHPDVVQAQVDALRSAAGNVLMSGVFLQDSDPQRVLERRMAEFLGVEATVLCQSGWAANVGLIQAIAGPGVPVYIDMVAHASLWEGIHSARATARPFAHNHLGRLERLLDEHGPGVIAVDTVYSVGGDLCPLAEIAELAGRFGCLLVADESHSLGTHGEYGAGLVAGSGLQDRVAFRTASLAKAFAGRAGVIGCSAHLAEHYLQEALPAVFSSALLPHDIAGLAAVLEIVTRDQWRRDRLARNAQLLRDGLGELGYRTAPSQSHIISLQPGAEPALFTVQRALDARGIYGAPFVPPATTKNGVALRLSVQCTLDEGQIERILTACADVRDEVGQPHWPSSRRLTRAKLRDSAAA